MRNLCQGMTSDVFLGEIIENGTSTGKLVALKRFKGEDGRKLGETEKINIEKLLQIKSLQKIPIFANCSAIYGNRENIAIPLFWNMVNKHCISQ